METIIIVSLFYDYNIFFFIIMVKSSKKKFNSVLDIKLNSSNVFNISTINSDPNSDSNEIEVLCIPAIESEQINNLKSEELSNIQLEPFDDLKLEESLNIQSEPLNDSKLGEQININLELLNIKSESHNESKSDEPLNIESEPIDNFSMLELLNIQSNSNSNHDLEESLDIQIIKSEQINDFKLEEPIKSEPINDFKLEETISQEFNNNSGILNFDDFMSNKNIRLKNSISLETDVSSDIDSKFLKIILDREEKVKHYLRLTNDLTIKLKILELKKEELENIYKNLMDDIISLDVNIGILSQKKDNSKNNYNLVDYKPISKPNIPNQIDHAISRLSLNTDISNETDYNKKVNYRENPKENISPRSVIENHIDDNKENHIETIPINLNQTRTNKYHLLAAKRR